jgi:hypothetical protein
MTVSEKTEELLRVGNSTSQLLNACQKADGHGNKMMAFQCPDLSLPAHQ